MIPSVRNNHSSRQKASRYLLVPALTALAFLGCVVELDNEAEPLRMEAELDGDTVSVFPRITVVFSEPVADSTVDFEFSPLFYDHYPQMSAGGDSVDIIVTGMLRGKTRYVIRPAHRISSFNGAVLNPRRDSIVLNTFPVEEEPNGSVATADSLTAKTFGMIATAHDTDTYICSGPAARTVYLTWFGTAGTFSLIDSDGNSRGGARPEGSADTIVIPDTFTVPLTVRVFAFQQLSDARYELGIVAAP